MASEIRHVSLTPGDFLDDGDFVAWTPDLRGVYWTLILFLYRNGGKLRDDPDRLKVLCNWTGEGWKSAYQVVRAKMQVRRGFITHKRVTKELARAQARRDSAVAAANTRWDRNADAMRPQCERNAKGREGKGSNKKKKTASAAKPRNEFWDAITEAFGLDPQTDPEKSRVGKLARELKAKTTDPKALAGKVAAYKKQMPGMACTPEAVMKHWDQLGSEFVGSVADDDGLPYKAKAITAEVEAIIRSMDNPDAD